MQNQLAKLFKFFLLMLIFFCFAQRALAKTSVRLRYVLAPDAQDCPNEASIKNAVAARLGYMPWNEQSEQLIIAVVGKENEILNARIEMRNKQGKVVGNRLIKSEQNDCRELAEAFVLAISIAIDPLSISRPEAKQPPAQKIETSAQPDFSPSIVKSEKPRSSVKLSVSAGGLVAIGSAPDIAGGITLQTRLGWKYFSFALEGRIDLPAYKDVSGGQISSSLLLGSIVACGHYGYFMGCGLFSAGALRAAGHDLQNPENVTRPYMSGGFRLGGEFPLFSILFLRAYADLLPTFTRITLRETNTHKEFWRTPALSGAFGLAVMGKIL